MSILSEKTVLVQLSVSQWYNKKTDTAVTKKVALDYDIKKQEDYYVKRLIPQEALRFIDKEARRLRDVHHTLSLPWQDNNVRILPASMIFRYTSEINAIKHEFFRAVEQFISEYPRWIIDAANTRGALFNIQDYPAAEELRKKFDIRIVLLPFPSTADFRLVMEQTELDKIKKETDEFLQQTITQSANALFVKLYERLEFLRNALSPLDKVFRDYSVESVSEICELAHDLNISDNVALTSLVTTTENLMRHITPTAMRTNLEARNTLITLLTKHLDTWSAEYGSCLKTA